MLLRRRFSAIRPIAFLGAFLIFGTSCLTAAQKTVFGMRLSIIFVGDTSFGENYQEKIKGRGGENILKTKGYAYNLKNFDIFLKKADLVIANLETPVTDLPSSPLEGEKTYLHWSDPLKTPKNLKEHNIRVVSLANNHSLDFGPLGLQQSLEILKKHNLRWLGAGLDEASASKLLCFDYLLTGQLFRLIIAAGFEYRYNYDHIYNFYADGDKGGTNAWAAASAFRQIKSIRYANPEAFVVAYPHFGKNYARKTEEETKLAHALIDRGADLVIGHGAHVLQEIELYQGRWIVYNLGNFVFNSTGRYKKKEIDPFSLMANLSVARKKNGLSVSLRLYPIFSDNRITLFQPHFVTDNQFEKAQKKSSFQSLPE
jgi:poly-gamma-glutamate capsule biosynthesis protein CapA/YwtB (metallophosphatase superfamily)